MSLSTQCRSIRIKFIKKILDIIKSEYIWYDAQFRAKCKKFKSIEEKFSQIILTIDFILYIDTIIFFNIK